MEISATQKFVRMSPKKVRVIIPLVKNLGPIQAVEVLPHLGKKAAEPLVKVFLSAIANARQRGISDKDLLVKEIQVNEGPRLKRGRWGARGRLKPYKRRMSHIKIVLTTKEPEVIKEAREKVAAKRDLESREKDIGGGRGGKSPSE